MLKLILLILALAGFLIYKASILQVKRKPTPKVYSIKKETLQKLPTVPSAAPVPETPSVPTAVAVTPERAQFDSLQDVYREAEPIDEDKLTPQEADAHKANLQRIQQIEEEARRLQGPAKSKSWESMTPEEKKAFEIYQKFENSEGNPNEK